MVSAVAIGPWDVAIGASGEEYNLHCLGWLCGLTGMILRLVGGTADCVGGRYQYNSQQGDHAHCKKDAWSVQ